jgi:hypothetical protein
MKSIHQLRMRDAEIEASASLMMLADKLKQDGVELFRYEEVDAYLAKMSEENKIYYADGQVIWL